MLFGTGDKILTTQNNRVPYRLPDILQLSYANFGTTIGVLDARRYFGNYRTSQPANNTSLGIYASPPMNVVGSSVFAFNGSANSPTNLKFNTADFSYPTFKIVNDVYKTEIANTATNAINGASSLTCAARFKLDSVNTSNNVGLLCSFLNNSLNASRFAIYFDNQYGVGNGVLVLEVNNLDSATPYYTVLNVNLATLYNKWVTLIVDFNYITKTARCWLNGILVHTYVISAMASAAIPNTNCAYINFFASTTYNWVGYLSVIRFAINGAITDDDALKLHNNLEFLTLTN